MRVNAGKALFGNPCSSATTRNIREISRRPKWTYCTGLKHRPEEGVGVSSGCVMVLVVSIGLVNWGCVMEGCDEGPWELWDWRFGAVLVLWVDEVVLMIEWVIISEELREGTVTVPGLTVVVGADKDKCFYW